MIKEIQLLVKLHELNDNKIIKVKDKYPALKTRKRNVENWWNSLTYLQKIDVGSAALHYQKISANYRWMCHEHAKFNDLTNGQQKIVKSIFNKKNDNWYMFDVMGMFKI